MTSSTKPEVHEVLQCYQPWPLVTCTENFMTFGHVACHMRLNRQIYRQRDTHRYTHHNMWHPY